MLTTSIAATCLLLVSQGQIVGTDETGGEHARQLEALESAVVAMKATDFTRAECDRICNLVRNNSAINASGAVWYCYSIDEAWDSTRLWSVWTSAGADGRLVGLFLDLDAQDRKGTAPRSERVIRLADSLLPYFWDGGPDSLLFQYSLALDIGPPRAPIEEKREFIRRLRKLAAKDGQIRVMHEDAAAPGAFLVLISDEKLRVRHTATRAELLSICAAASPKYPTVLDNLAVSRIEESPARLFMLNHLEQVSKEVPRLLAIGAEGLVARDTEPGRYVFYFRATVGQGGLRRIVSDIRVEEPPWVRLTRKGSLGPLDAESLATLAVSAKGVWEAPPYSYGADPQSWALHIHN